MEILSVFIFTLEWIAEACGLVSIYYLSDLSKLLTRHIHESTDVREVC